MSGKVTVLVRPLRLEQKIGVCVERNGWAHSFFIPVKDGVLPPGYEADPEIMAAYREVQAAFDKSQRREFSTHSDDPQPNSLGRTVMLHLHHPTLGDGLLAPVIKDALRAYLARMDDPGFNPPSLESTLLQSGVILSVVALPVPLGGPNLDV